MGAKVHGIALDPNTKPNLFTAAEIKKIIESDMRFDIRDEKNIGCAFKKIKPQVVFHLAAQPLVRPSYECPIYTFETNSLGTVNVLDAIRNTDSVKVAVMITTDKVYENHEWPHPYREVDPLGGSDPYSASKACAEIITDSYRKSFLEKQKKSVSSVRAGNVIGGGDWSKDRLIPDAIKAFASKKSLILRNPDSTRPWQYILDPLCGYLLLAEAQWKEPKRFARAWNFAPYDGIDATVGEIANVISDLWGEGAKVKVERDKDAPHESNLLNLDSSLARMQLGWRQRCPLLESLKNTVSWYKAFNNKEDMKKFSLNQIEWYKAVENKQYSLNPNEEYMAGEKRYD
jgi:CDP-glucose 4,6-dehydratase